MALFYITINNFYSARLQMSSTIILPMYMSVYVWCVSICWHTAYSLHPVIIIMAIVFIAALTHSTWCMCNAHLFGAISLFSFSTGIRWCIRLLSNAIFIRWEKFEQPNERWTHDEMKEDAHRVWDTTTKIARKTHEKRATFAFYEIDEFSITRL